MHHKAPTDLLRRIGTREITLNHAAFDEIGTLAAEHIRSMLVHHHILPDPGSPELVRFESWLTSRLHEFDGHPSLQQPLEQFARWHHLRRLRADPPPRNMDTATRTAKQEITETGKFLRWLDTEHHATINTATQTLVDTYLVAGPSTRRHIRNFINWRKRSGSDAGASVRLRVKA